MDEESVLLALDPLIPWPADHIDMAATCHLRLSLLVERFGWEQARSCPEVRRLSRTLTETPISEIDFGTFLDPDDLARDRADNKTRSQCGPNKGEHN